MVRKGVIELDASTRQSIDVRCLDIGIAKTTQAIGSLLVRHHDQEIGSCHIGLNLVLVR